MNSFFFGGKGHWVLRLLRFFYHLPNFVRLTYRLFGDERVPIYRKMVLILAQLLAVVFAIVYFVNPIDLDYLPFGRIDDLLVGVFLILVPGGWLFIRLCPEAVVREHVDRISRGQ